MTSSAPRKDRISNVLVAQFGHDGARELVQRAWEDAQIKAARMDPDAFIEYVARDRHGNRFLQGKIHRKMQRFIPRSENVQEQWLGLIGLPRAHGKTEQAAWRDIWELGIDPTLRLKIVTETDELGEKVAGKIRSVIECDPLVRRVFPDLRPGKPWTGGKFRVAGAALGEKEYSVEVVSVTSAATGGRADYIHCDDVMGPSIVGQPARMARIIDMFEETFINLLESDGGRVVYCFTPWHIHDLSMQLMNNPAWHKLYYPVYQVRGGKKYFLWPERWNEKNLEARRKSLRNDRMFARQFMMKPLSDEELIFPNEVLIPSLDPNIVYGSPEHREMTQSLPKYAGVDVASSLSDKAAYNVITTVGVTEESKKLLVDIIRGKWRSHEIDEILYMHWRQHRHRAIVVESNGFQKSIVDRAQNASERAIREGKQDEVRELMRYGASVVAFHTTRVNKPSEELGIRQLAAQMARGEWVIPVGQLLARGFEPENPTCLLSWPLPLVATDPVAVWLREMLEYTASETGSTYTDTVMAAWFTSWAVGDMGSIGTVVTAAARSW